MPLQPSEQLAEADQPTSVRFLVVGVTTLGAVMLYLDRLCISFTERYIKTEIGLSDKQISWILGSFFLTYALGQVPSGWFADRFGARRMLTAYIVLWSLFTGLTGLASSFIAVITCRGLFGVAQAGGYPTSAALLAKWVPISRRGAASSVVALGGRIGGTIAQVLTGYLIVFGWRPIMQFYCCAGLAVAIAVWIVVRDRPSDDSSCNAAERRLIGSDEAGDSHRTARLRDNIPAWPLLASASLWLSSLSQFMTNLAWVFLATWLPRYLDEVHDVAPEQRGWLAGVPILVGSIGMLAGGWLTDGLVRMVGLRWGRALPMSLSRFVAMGAYLVCLAHPSAWGATAAFSVVAFATDVGVGATWAFLQDVGGRHVGSILGWTNMWGNFGAAIAPILLNAALDQFNTWDAVFITCAIAFLISGVAALGVDATRRISDRAPGTESSP